MQLQTTISGSLPKLPLAQGEVNMRVVRNRCDEGKAKAEDLVAAVRATTERMVVQQERHEIDLPMDGQAAWDDAQTYVASRLRGVEIAGLIRYLDTNTYYRQPEIVGPIAWERPITVHDFRFAQSLTKRPVKAFLPGPYSLVLFSKDLHYKDSLETLRAMGEALGREAAALEQAGAVWIHFEEPWLGRAQGGDAEGARAALEPALRGRTARTLIHVPFGTPAPVLDALAQLPWSAIGLDLAERPANWDLLPRIPSGRTVALGLLHARNTRLEDPSSVARDVERARVARPDLSYQLCPNASLEYLPVDRADQKLARLAEAARIARGNGVRS